MKTTKPNSRGSILALALALTLAAVAALVTAPPLGAQSRKRYTINTGTPEGRLMQAINAESDPQKRLDMAESFLSQYPSHEGAAWVWSNVQDAALQAGQFDKAIAAGEKLLAADPTDFDAAYVNLKAAEGKKDPDAVLRWSATTSALARKAVTAPRTADEDPADFAKKGEHAKEVDTYTEYALYSSAIASGDPAKIVAMGVEMEKRTPPGQYHASMYPAYFAALRQTGNMAGAVAAGERAYAANLADEGMLLVMADYSMQQKSSPEKVIEYSNKIVSILGAKAKPEGISDADWIKRKNQMLAVSNWMAGVTYASQSKWGDADKSLRAALPLVQGGDPTMLAATLFHLGVANYNLGKAAKDRAVMEEALKFSEQCAAIESPLKAGAQGNAKAIRAEMPAARAKKAAGKKK